MRSAYLFSTLAIMATSVSADFFGLLGATFTFNSDPQAGGVRVGPEDIGPHPYDTNHKNEGCVTPDSGIIGSVTVDSIIDMGNTDYCILGYDVADCDGIQVDHKDWDSRPNKEHIYDFTQLVASAKVIEGTCEPVLKDLGA